MASKYGFLWPLSRDKGTGKGGLNNDPCSLWGSDESERVRGWVGGDGTEVSVGCKYRIFVHVTHTALRCFLVLCW